MALHWIDWIIIGTLLVLLLGIALLSKSLTRSVADFLAGNRCAGRYLLTMADGMAGLGAITIAANFEQFYEAGFAAAWWGQILAPIGLVLALSGFVIYRYRETRAMTMAQFFEVRYSRRFRIFAGLLAFVSGILNYGIFPAVTARFIIYFCGLPQQTEFLSWTFPTLAPVMLVLLSIALTLTLLGGQIAIIITDFLQGQFVQIVILITFFVMLAQISWADLIIGLEMAPEEASRINPFKQGETKGFNAAFFLIVASLNVYGFKAWQGSQGYNAAPKSPHEAKMANILGMFRGQVLFLLSMLIPLFVFAMLHLPEFAVHASAVNETLASIDSPQIREQMRVPAGVAQLLPAGVMGLFVAMIIAAAVSTDDTYLHSWGSIFVQDVIMPFRKKPLSRKAHLRSLRGAIFGVAVFAFIFSLLFPLEEYIFMYFQITGAIYLGGAGAVILGGLYWKRGSVEGAWAAMSIGSTLAVVGIVVRNIIWPYFLPNWKIDSPDIQWLQALPETFPLNGVQMSGIVALVAVSCYVLFSLLSRRPPANMDKLLHRGKYAVETFERHGIAQAAVAEVLADAEVSLDRRHLFWKRIGVNSEFSKGDKIIYLFKIGFSLFFFFAFIIGSLTAVTVGISDANWIRWWAFTVIATLILGVGSTVWFLVGGFHDLFYLIRTLRGALRDDADDGSVRREDHLQEKD
ncbi:MAG: sodium:solute symporter [Lentimonas sp.]